MLLFKKNLRLIFLLIILLFSLYATFLNISVSQKLNFDNSLVLLSNQFTHKHISLQPTTTMPLGDISKYSGKYYLYFGPFPSILLIPFVLVFGQNFPQIFVGLLSLFLTFIAIYLLAKTFKFSIIDALWLSIFFVFSTVLLSSSIIDITAYQVEALGVPFVLLSLNEYFSKKRPLLIGLYLGLAILTRATLVLAVVFFLLEFFQKRLTLKQLLLLFVPLTVCCTLFGIYDYARFHSFFETGYKYNITLHSYPLSLNLKYGYMSLTHIPANLYSFLLMPPQPLIANAPGFVLKYPYLKVSPWGLAIWFTSPLFLIFLYKVRKSAYTFSALITTLVLAVPLFLYYSVGFAQFGYRYSLDFLPFLFLLLLPSLLPKLSKKEIALIVLGILFNAIYMTSSWGIYPLLGIYH